MNKEDEVEVLARVDTHLVLELVASEAEKARAKHGDQMHLPLTSPDSAPKYVRLAEAQKKFVDHMSAAGGTITWQDITLEEVFECFAETEPAKIREEALQAAAMFVQIVRRCDKLIQASDG